MFQGFQNSLCLSPALTVIKFFPSEFYGKTAKKYDTTTLPKNETSIGEHMQKKSFLYVYSPSFGPKKILIASHVPLKTDREINFYLLI